MLCWGLSKAMAIKLKDMCPLRDHKIISTNQLYIEIWKLEVSMTVKTLWWKLLWRRLSCEQVLCHKNIIPTTQ